MNLLGNSNVIAVAHGDDLKHEDNLHVGGRKPPVNQKVVAECAPCQHRAHSLSMKPAGLVRDGAKEAFKVGS